MGRVEGKVAIVTGAARGTGEQTARLLAEEGAKVVIADILEAEAHAVAEALGDAARFERLDVTDEESWAGVVGATCSHFGPPTVLVNNAGLLHMQALVETSAADTLRRRTYQPSTDPDAAAELVTEEYHSGRDEWHIVGRESLTALVINGETVDYDDDGDAGADG